MNFKCKQCGRMLRPDSSLFIIHESQHERNNLFEFEARMEKILNKEFSSSNPASIRLIAIREAYQDYKDYRFPGFEEID